MIEQTQTDEQLVQASLHDVNAFALLIERYEKKLQRYILRISSFSPQEAEEVLQEVFLKAWKNLNEFNLSLKFSSWIYRIAHNQTISQFRKHRKGGQKEYQVESELFDIIPDELDIPEQFDRQQRANLVRDSLKNLPKEYREVLILRYFEDKSYEEMSDILMKPSGTVGVLLNRAKKSLKDFLKKSPVTLTL
ncbi:MAG: RNA polymerase sigma factor [bacterium]|nr:RNA polymerase sigma factor [bacterium]